MQLHNQPEAAFIKTSERDTFVTNIPNFTPKKVMNRTMMEKLWLDPDKIAQQVETALRKSRREK
jgi:hypothetical protein